MSMGAQERLQIRQQTSKRRMLLQRLLDARTAR